MDKTKLTPANDNPWYLMMTLYGEQEGIAADWFQEMQEMNWDTAALNRKLWNAWVCQTLDKEEISRLASALSVEVESLSWTPEKQSELEIRFQERCSASQLSLRIPEPTQIADLSATYFSKKIMAQKMIFPALDCDGARFEDMVDFNNAQFLGTPDFSNSYFNGRAIFTSAHIRSDAIFSDVCFAERVYFSGTRFCGDFVFFINTRFAKFSHFIGAQFGDFDVKKSCRAEFANAVFDGPTNFNDARFVGELPSFSGASLHDTTVFTAKDALWPPKRYGVLKRFDVVLGLRRAEPFPPQDPEKAKASAAKLRHVMANQALPEEEHFFFRREMHHTARAQAPWKTAHIYLFEAVSDFGYSIGRPAGLILGVWTIGWLVYATQTSFGWGKAAAFSFASMFKFFGFQQTYFTAETVKLSEGLQVFAAAQTVLAFALLFFLGLGFRTRFRLR